jgi:hypothetical protein
MRNVLSPSGISGEGRFVMKYRTSPRKYNNHEVRTQAQAWLERAEELVGWTTEHLVNRKDCFGQYRSPKQIGLKYINREGKEKTLGSQTTIFKPVTRERLLRHFRPVKRTDIMGLHFADANNLSKGGGIDIDNHEGDEDRYAINLQAALHWYKVLVQLGFHPLLTDAGGLGSFHLRILLAGTVPGELMFRFMRWLVRDHREVGLERPPETFPRQADVRNCPEGVGNWLRALGKHHTREHWSTVWNGEETFLEGHDAIDHILSLTGDPVELLDQVPLPAQQPRSTPADREVNGRLHGSRVSALPPGSSELSSYSSFHKGTSIREDVDAEKVAQLVTRHLPTATTQRHRKLFDLAQAVKGLPGEWTRERLWGVFNRWWPKAEPVVATKDRETSWLEFLDAFELCQFPGGMDWDLVVDQAAKEPLPPAAEFYLDRTRLLVGICSVLQRLHRSRPFYLSLELAGNLLGGVSVQTAARTFDRLIKDGLLERVSVGNNFTGKASEYRYVPLAGVTGECLDDDS